MSTPYTSFRFRAQKWLSLHVFTLDFLVIYLVFWTGISMSNLLDSDDREICRLPPASPLGGGDVGRSGMASEAPKREVRPFPDAFRDVERPTVA